MQEQKQEVKLIFPKFRVGDRIFKTHNSDINKCGIFTITKITEQGYWYDDVVICAINEEDEWELEKEGWRNPVGAYKNGYEQGKQDALKDLPKWEKSYNNPKLSEVVPYLGDYVLYWKGYYIRMKDLNKLPKEE